jgi:hypothetical protein
LTSGSHDNFSGRGHVLAVAEICKRNSMSGRSTRTKFKTSPLKGAWSRHEAYSPVYQYSKKDAKLAPRRSSHIRARRSKSLDEHVARIQEPYFRHVGTPFRNHIARTRFGDNLSPKMREVDGVVYQTSPHSSPKRLTPQEKLQNVSNNRLV